MAMTRVEFTAYLRRSILRLGHHIAFIRPNAPLFVEDGERLNGDPVLENYGLYGLAMSPFTTRSRANVPVFTTTAEYFNVADEEPREWDGVSALKWDFTSRSFIERGPEVVREATEGKGYPTDDLDPVVVAALTGLPRDERLLHQLEHALRNLMTTYELRLPYYARDTQLMPRNRTLHSESFEYAKFRRGRAAVFRPYRELAQALNGALQRARTEINRQDFDRGTFINNRVSERRGALYQTREELRSTHRAAVRQLQNELRDASVEDRTDQLQRLRRSHTVEARTLRRDHDENLRLYRANLEDTIPKTDVKGVLDRALILAALAYRGNALGSERAACEGGSSRAAVR
jgi:hypothetical protein